MIHRINAAAGAIALLLCLPLTNPVSAAPAGAVTAEADLPAVSAGKLSEILKPLEAKALSGRFEERKTIPGFPKPMVTTGRFSLEGSTLVWEAENPFPSKMTISPEGVVTEAAGEKQVLSAADIPAVGRVSELLTGVLAGRFEALSDLFEIRAAKAGDGKVTISAKPRPKELAGFMSEVRATGVTYFEEIHLRSPRGEDTQITFTDVVSQR